MDQIQLLEDIILFNSYYSEIDLTFNQYLLLGKESILIHTGNKNQADDLIPRLKKILCKKPLSYIFVSHFESDECGGLAKLLKFFPEAKTVCSQVSARQLSGFDITENLLIKSPNNLLETPDYQFKFIPYPSEMHLWEGLLFFEEKKGYLFSSDLFMSKGKIAKSIQPSLKENEIQKINPAQIPNTQALISLQTTLKTMPVKYIFPGHGSSLSF